MAPQGEHYYVGLSVGLGSDRFFRDLPAVMFLVQTNDKSDD